MVKFKGTKGIWEYSIKDYGVNSTDKNIEGNIICLPPEGYIPSLENWSANAKLIASAPELLEALQALKSQFNEMVLDEDMTLDEGDTEVLQQVDNAIEKALK